MSSVLVEGQQKNNQIKFIQKNDVKLYIPQQKSKTGRYLNLSPFIASSSQIYPQG